MRRSAGPGAFVIVDAQSNNTVAAGMILERDVLHAGTPALTANNKPAW